METRKYKTLAGLFRGLETDCMTFNNYKAGRAWVKSARKKVRFELSPELDGQIRAMFASAICSKKTAARKYAGLMQYSRYGAGILDRLVITLSGKGTFESSYIAGQDYIWEIRCIQRYLCN